MTARAVNRRALDLLAIAVHQGRVSPDKLNGLRQKNTQRTADATACIEIAFNISKAIDNTDTPTRVNSRGSQTGAQ